jgi:hypothetical protein
VWFLAQVKGYHKLQCCLVMDLIKKLFLVPDACRPDGKQR